MTQTIGSDARIRWNRRDRLNPERTDRDIRAILELCIEVRKAWEEAADLGSYAIRNGEQMTLGRNFTDSDPTHAAAIAPTRRQVRQAARQAAELIEEARAHLVDASDTLHRALKRTDPEVLAEFLEKRQAATQR